ncbi:MAG: hexokinase [Phycisphaerae bacterium]|nr:hexokinase [Phycisphaerae bacterium]
MEKIRRRVNTFLSEQGMFHGDISISETCAVFQSEMDKGLAGKKSSLAMLPTYIETEEELPRDKAVIVMDAGGTNFRVATVVFRQSGQTEITNFKNYPMPGITAEVGKEEFFGTMAGYVRDLAEKSGSVGFCFSYPIEMFPSKDGRALYFSKEIKAPKAAGQMIGENMGRALKLLGISDLKHFVLLNDTVATLLAGRAEASGRKFDSYIGFILGTGTNTAYVEQNKNIKKAKDLDPDKGQIVNVESGGFGKAPRGKIDKAFDAASVSPGVNVFEKMISGAYIGPLCLVTALSAAKAGLFSTATAERLAGISVATSKDISNFLSCPEGGDDPLSLALAGASEDDATTLYCLVDALVERAAKLTAVNLSSVSLKSGKGLNPCRPICIVAEGTTFYRLKSLQQKIEYYLKQYLVDKKHVYYEIVNVKDATLIGAAIAGLTN